ncbi:MAG: hypothetical protein BGO14_00640 [Chlamydiales bacterium 38-26]|nr:protease-like activity factor CPAF [Chlamydiales bacterium]OJV07230.1 MAG: hypothetical protein BGO14_00640 [Chlamydiales bacterium 38-26]
MKYIKCLSVIIFFIVSLPSWGCSDALSDKKQMILELEGIKHIFQMQYAPMQWKKEQFAWELEDEIETAKQKVLSFDEVTIQDFHGIVKKIFASLRDFHVNVSFFTTESAYLPIQIRGAEGRYFIVHVDKKQLSPQLFPIKPGDEILYFDDKPIAQAMEDFQIQEFGDNKGKTQKTKSEIMFTHRQAGRGHQIPQGPVIIQVKHQGVEGVKSYQLTWAYTPEKIIQDLPLSNKKQANYNLGKKSNKKNFKEILRSLDKPWMTPYYKPSLNHIFEPSESHKEENDPKEEENESPFILGAKKSMLPPLGRIWWKNEKKYWNAYIFETPERRLVGYLRIPHYVDYLGESVKELAEIIQLFEERTDALVIDQLNNPGGLIFYMYSIASLLSNQALTTPRHHIKLTHADVFNALECIPALEDVSDDLEAEFLFGRHYGGYPVSYQFCQCWLHYCRFIQEEWTQGKTFTDAIHLLGVDAVNPHPAAFTKPILLLINELDFSCGDFFPAILQDNQRVTTMGVQTAGAGGFVTFTPLKSRFSIGGFNITGSIAERADKSYIENAGVIPDVHYEISASDYQNHFFSFKEAILNELCKIIK